MSKAQEPNTVDFEVAATLTFVITVDTNMEGHSGLDIPMLKQAWKDAVAEWVMEDALPWTISVTELRPT